MATDHVNECRYETVWGDMASSGLISLKAYALRMNKKGRPSSIIFKNDVVHKVLDACLDELKTPSGATSGAVPTGRLFALDNNTYKKQSGPDGYVLGKLRAGTGGYSSDILEKRGKLAFSRTPDHVEVLPYYFQMSIPASARVPILCIQQFSGSGVLEFFQGVFMERLREHLVNDDITVSLRPIYLSNLYIKEFYEKGVVRKITATTHVQPTDRADEARAAKIHSELLLSPVRRGRPLGTLKEMLAGDGGMSTDKKVVFENIRQIYELNVDGGTIGDLIIEAELGGVRRRISIGSDFGTTFDITDEIDTDKSGHPKTASMDKYVTDFISKSIRSYIGIN